MPHGVVFSLFMACKMAGSQAYALVGERAPARATLECVFLLGGVAFLTPLATEAYGGELSADGETLELPGLVSRKKDLIPAITKAVKGGWTPPREVVEEHEKARRISQNFDAEKSPGASQPALKRSRSMAEVASGDVVVDYSEEPSGKIVRKDVSASGGGA